MELINFVKKKHTHTTFVRVGVWRTRHCRGDPFVVVRYLKLI